MTESAYRRYARCKSKPDTAMTLSDLLCNRLAPRPRVLACGLALAALSFSPAGAQIPDGYFSIDSVTFTSSITLPTSPGSFETDTSAQTVELADPANTFAGAEERYVGSSFFFSRDPNAEDPEAASNPDFAQWSSDFTADAYFSFSPRAVSFLSTIRAESANQRFGEYPAVASPASELIQTDGESVVTFTLAKPTIMRFFVPQISFAGVNGPFPIQTLSGSVRLTQAGTEVSASSRSLTQFGTSSAPNSVLNPTIDLAAGTYSVRLTLDLDTASLSTSSPASTSRVSALTSVSMVFSPAPFVWTGESDRQFRTAGNWRGNAVPNATDAVDFTTPGISTVNFQTADLAEVLQVRAASNSDTTLVLNGITFRIGDATAPRFGFSTFEVTGAHFGINGGTLDLANGNLLVRNNGATAGDLSVFSGATLKLNDARVNLRGAEG